MQQSRRTATVGLIAVGAVMAALSLSGRGLGDLFVPGSGGEDHAKLDSLERLQASLRKGAAEEEAKVLLAREGVAYRTGPQDDHIIGTVDRVRWDSDSSESVVIDIGMEQGRVAAIEFKSVFTGPSGR